MRACRVGPRWPPLWVYVSFASFAVLCELCANVSLFLERIPFAQSSQRTAKLVTLTSRGSQAIS